ncbi:MAG: EMC3/TMCO1 family protein [Methanomassiliicoccales archaeon]
MKNQQPQTPQVPQGTGSMFISLFVMLALLIAFLNPGFRDATVSALSVVLNPTIGLSGQFPIITVMLAELIVVLVGTTLRIIFTDFVEQARLQTIMGALRKEQREAFKSRDQDRIKKLNQVQNSYLVENTQLMNKQMRILPVTLIIIFPLFTWLGIFLLKLHYPAFTLPWSYRTYFTHYFLVFPTWVYLYAILGIPFTQIYQRALRYLILKRRLEKLTAH